MGRFTARLAGVLAVIIGTSGLLVPTSAAAPARAEAPARTGTPASTEIPADPGAATQCALPGAGEAVRRAKPEDVNLDPAAVREAMRYANTHLRLSVRIHRNNCEVGTGALDPVTQGAPWNVWSSTKGVISMLTGIAYDHGKLALDDPIGKYLPAGWGDRAHRAITVRQLLTETSGLSEAILSEAATTGTDANVVRQALALPIEHRPGTNFEYSQRTPDLLGYVVQRAVGEDLQEFAQRELFGPIGIPDNSYFWLRDRSGNTYGYAHLFIPPREFARLGLLMQNNGSWQGRRIISDDYMNQARQPTTTNPCYGFLFWVNKGQRCVTADIPSERTLDRRMVPSAPDDMFAQVGAFQQNNFVIPSLDMTVSWTGLGGDLAPDPQAMLSASPGADLYHEFFRILLRGVRDRPVPDPGSFPGDTPNLDVNPVNYLDPRVLLNGVAAAPDCNLLVCNGTVPTKGALRNAQSIVNALAGYRP
ncbi:MAG: serine hydrolase [Pseudonocardiaceae bacterium]|nr:serine hydrolase [Pseudonocardiaceae bacterium]